MQTEFNNWIFPQGLGVGIAYKDNVFDPTFCKMLIDYIHAEENINLFEKGRTADPTVDGWKFSVDVGLGQGNARATSAQNIMLKMFGDQVFRNLTDELLTYTSLYEHFDLWEDRYDSGYRYQFYKKNKGQYKVHVDGSVFDKPGYCERVLAGIVYLNTVEEGGETEFPIHNLKIKAVEGRLSLFPTSFNYPHAGLMPISGDKHIISTFFTSPVIGEKLEIYKRGFTPVFEQYEPDLSMLEEN